MIRHLHIRSLLSLLVAVVAVVPGSASSAVREARIRADRLTMDHDKRRADFFGHVRAEYGELTLLCDSMTLSYNDGGDVATLTATGRVTVTRGDATATASTAVLQAQEGLLILEGNPVLIKGNNRLEGSRIRVHLKSFEIKVENAKGTFQLGREAPR